MKRHIEICRIQKLTMNDYKKFIEECYKFWSVLPVSNVDLIIEYIEDFNQSAILNTENEYIISCPNYDSSLEKICNFAETGIDLHCNQYIIARIRDKKVKEYYLIKRVAH